MGTDGDQTPAFEGGEGPKESGACVVYPGANDPREVVTQARKSGDRRGEVASRTQEQTRSDEGSAEEVDRR